MKQLFSIIILGFLTLSSFSQTWLYYQGENPFDGKYKSCFVRGVCHDAPLNKPCFTISAFNKYQSEPNIFLTGVPFGGCDNNRVEIKFDNDERLYKPGVTVSKDNDTWFIHFEKSALSVKDSIKSLIKRYIIPKYQFVTLNSEPDANSQITGQLFARDTLYLINLDTLSSYWKCIHNDKSYYCHESYIVDAEKNATDLNEEKWFSFNKVVMVDELFRQFITKIKNHNVMYVHMQSDCIKSDLEFSLKGSSAAVDFVLKE